MTTRTLQGKYAEDLEKRIKKAIKMLYRLEENMNKDLKMWYGAGLDIKHFEVRDIRDIVKTLEGKDDRK